MHCLPIFSKRHFLFMIRKNFFNVAAAVALILLLALSGCKQDKLKEGPQPTGYELNRTDRDTVAVTQLVDRFFGYLESGQLTDAVAMLFKMNPDDVYEEPQLLDNEQLAEVSKTYRMLMPIRGHHIDYIKFNQAYDNEVKVTVILEEEHDGMPAMTTTMYFKAYDYLTTWRLCTFNTNDGNRRTISNAQADSMQNRYAEELDAKQGAQVQQ